MKFLQFIIFVMLLLMIIEAKEKIEYWHSTLPDNWDVYYEIIQDDESYKGKFVSYLNGMQFAGDNMGKVIITKDSISMVTNIKANIIYKGIFNKDRTIVNGKNIYPDGSSLEISLKKLNKPVPERFYPRLNNSIVNYPKNDDNEFQYISIEEAGFSQCAVNSLLNKIISREVGEIHAVLIAKDEKIVLEEYFYDYNESKTHRLHSCTKSIVSLLVGKALEENIFPDLDTELSQLFPENNINKKLKHVTLENLLSMTSGFSKFFKEQNPDKDWKEVLFSIKRISKPGKKFRYDDNNSYLLGELLEHKTGKTIDKYAEEKLFKPLEITQYHWEKEDMHPTAHTGLALRARDLLKFGLMVANNGKWNGQQIISSDWIKKSTHPQINVADYLDYGLHWWSIQGKEFGFKHDIPLAQGAGGQRLIIIPEMDIVCVIFGGNFDQWNSIENDIWEIIK